MGCIDLGGLAPQNVADWQLRFAELSADGGTPGPPLEVFRDWVRDQARVGRTVDSAVATDMVNSGALRSAAAAGIEFRPPSGTHLVLQRRWDFEEAVCGGHERQYALVVGRLTAGPPQYGPFTVILRSAFVDSLLNATCLPYDSAQSQELWPVTTGVLDVDRLGTAVLPAEHRAISAAVAAARRGPAAAFADPDRQHRLLFDPTPDNPHLVELQLPPVLDKAGIEEVRYISLPVARAVVEANRALQGEQGGPWSLMRRQVQRDIRNSGPMVAALQEAGFTCVAVPPPKAFGPMPPEVGDGAPT